MAQVSRESAGMGLHEHRNAPLWRIELFGVLRVRRIDNGKASDRFRSRSAAALLAFLAYHSHSHEREMLTELLWPEHERESARRHLRVVLSSLRRVLEPSDVAAGSVILADRRFIALQVGTVTTDVAEFEAALHHASQASPRLQSTLLAQAVELYRGALLPGYYEDWITPQAQRLEELYFVVLRKLIARLESDGQYERAIEYAQRGVALSALREKVHHDLMRLYISIDEPMLALRQYRDLERVLALNFDIIPGPVPQELLRQIETKARCSQHCAVGHYVASGSTLSSLQETNTREGVTEAVAVATVQAERESSAQVDHRPRLSSNEFLPLQTTCFFGRSEETARLWQTLTQNQTRLVTLTGPGGSGKTRLALEAAQRLKREWHGHVWFVPLADLAGARLIPEEITSALDLSPLPTLTPLEQGLQFLGAQETPVILVLDNLEHLLPDGAPLIQSLLARVPHLRLLITSRQELRISDEYSFPVPPLPVPDTPVPKVSLAPDELLSYASVQLFYDRAQAVQPDFRITKHNAIIVARLCENLEGLPLAIELAAAHVRTHSVGEILARLKRRPDFLAEQPISGTYGHATLRAALQWSHTLLWPQLQQFFRQLSVFRGGFTCEAAAAVTQEPTAAHYLQQLQSASLLVAEEDNDGCRFRLLETVHEYALELLVQSGEESAVCRRHAEYFLQSAQTAYAHLLGGKEQNAWMQRLEVEADNLRAALAWLLKNDASSGLCLAVAMARYWRVAGRDTELSDLLKRALKHSAKAPAAIRVVALREMGEVLLRLGGQCPDNYRRATKFLVQSAQLCRELSDEQNLAWTLRKLGEGAQYSAGDLVTARVFFEEILSIERRRAEPFALAAALHYNGSLARDTGDFACARSLYEESVQLFRDSGNRYGMARPLTLLAALSYMENRAELARSYWEQSLPFFRELRDKGGLMWALRYLSELATTHGDRTAARRLLEERLQLNRELGNIEEVSRATQLLAQLEVTTA